MREKAKHSFRLIRQAGGDETASVQMTRREVEEVTERYLERGNTVQQLPTRPGQGAHSVIRVATILPSNLEE